MLSQDKFLCNKKAVSTIVGYILLVLIVMSMSAVTYKWLKSYVPKEHPECPESISLSIRNYDCTTIPGRISITFHNNGYFNISGVYAKATVSPNKKIATLNLAGQKGYVDFPPLRPGDTFPATLSYTQPIYRLELLPFIIDRTSGAQILCADATIAEKLNGDAGCQV